MTVFQHWMLIQEFHLLELHPRFLKIPQSVVKTIRLNNYLDTFPIHTRGESIATRNNHDYVLLLDLEQSQTLYLWLLDRKDMKKAAVFILVLITLAIIPTNVQGQVATPAVDLQCDGQVFFDVYPGANTTSIMNCTLTNPNTYNETIEMENSLSGDIHVDGFYATFPDGDVINLTAGEEKVITVKIVALNELPITPRVIQINATVIEANGSTPTSVARSVNNCILSVNAYDNYEVSPSFMFHQLDIVSDDPVEHQIVMSIVNNGNSAERLGIGSMSDLIQELDSYNMVVSIPATNYIVNYSDTYLFNFSIGSNSEINASTWLEFDNGTRQITIDTNITIVNVASNRGDYYCYQCNGSTNLIIQINLLPFEYQSDDDSDSVPGFEGYLSMVSIILAAFVIAQRNRY